MTTETSLPQFRWVWITFKAFQLLSIDNIMIMMNNLTNCFFLCWVHWYLKSKRTIKIKRTARRPIRKMGTVLQYYFLVRVLRLEGILIQVKFISFEEQGDLLKKRREEGWIQGHLFASVNESSIVQPVHLKTCRLWIKCHANDSPEPFMEGFKVNGSHNH